MKRRNFIKSTLLFVTSVQMFPNTILSFATEVHSNFKYIYTNSKLKNQFFLFLKNVFNLYPETEFHKLIYDNTISKTTDKEIYIATQSKLDDITPILSGLRYQLPALMHQKNEMSVETVALLGEGTSYNGYLEIGSSGRYLDYLEESISIKGKRYYADGRKPKYSFTEMVERGQIAVGAEYIQFTNYETKFADHVPKNSLDLVTVYIGFHHCPIDLRTQYISSIRDTMRVGGKLILRDHNCDTEDQKVLVALAHDVFNLGVNETWEYNAKEVRNFYSLDFICDFVEKIGFKFTKKTLYQKGDPTKNALMVFTKI
ncbi:methyltransferase family protein [Flavobacterium sp. 90]|uniref:methyltransferase domain-containing protein n=1 Tax=unclassified Flavobacterium TaxID=196869 RepID=UPI000EB27CDE|nr:MULTISPECIES: methyltransferase domain-containing protein [unclassified Flavobacterium]RKR08285.1 methyltransferase family protein [Flavobacterium sp. 81]TCK57473.1 methyltransferase family protein [Flavobacterium sp. 90]